MTRRWMHKGNRKGGSIEMALGSCTSNTKNGAPAQGHREVRREAGWPGGRAPRRAVFCTVVAISAFSPPSPLLCPLSYCPLSTLFPPLLALFCLETGSLDAYCGWRQMSLTGTSQARAGAVERGCGYFPIKDSKIDFFSSTFPFAKPGTMIGTCLVWGVEVAG